MRAIYNLEELKEVTRLIQILERKFSDYSETRLLAEISHRNGSFPVHGIILGKRGEHTNRPTLAFIGGVHGLERIGTQVVIAFLQSIVERLSWDQSLLEDLKQIRILFVPLLNPLGFALERRSNGNGVDLMRNSPINSPKPTPLVGGHRLSARLPWYRGVEGAPMEAEAQALVQFIEQQCFGNPFNLILDVHSGFGGIDQIWFPYAKSKEPFPGIKEVKLLKGLMDRVLPHHVYRFEPQSKHYQTHGDLWDYLVDRHQSKFSSDRFIPLTLELGSWIWVKKNPKQIFSFLGPFNPIKPHRIKRTLRRHLPLFDFLIRVTRSSEAWLKASEEGC